MKSKTILGVIAVAGVLCAFLVGRSTEQRQAAAGGIAAREARIVYTCGMHPQVVQDKPGNCPICGMKLTSIQRPIGAEPAAENATRKIKYYKSTMIPGEVSERPAKDSMGMDMQPVYEDEEGPGASGRIAIDPVTIQNMGIRTYVVTNGPLRRLIRTVGTIDYDERALADVTTKFRGWLEKLYADATGQLVAKGDPLFEIYSPELYSAQTEYVLAIAGAVTPETPDRNTLLQTARLKLKFFDISDDQIAELERTRQPRKTLRIAAPQSGFVINKMVVQGQMVDAGTTVYRLADLSTVWIYAQIYEQDLPFVHQGQEAVVRLSSFPDRKFHGRVTYIYPTVDENTRTTRARVELQNPGYLLKPGMFGSVELRAELELSALLVPDMAILRSGEKNTVFVALDGGRFEPRTVTLGPRAEGDMYQVLSGLKEGERVVTSGQFMLDSESQLREAIQKMLHQKKAIGVGAATGPAQGVETRAPAATPAKTQKDATTKYYTCPMEEHADVVSDAPDECPKCGMKLVETTKVKHGKLAEENWWKQHPVQAPENTGTGHQH
ncbi:MAG: efflux RND transporter periplasmic adaptor subunit [Verrucomicrobiota bacterium]|nr:efflux RND transporter periplasmic adaptor subunit [Verrucomicrobiota bacterium]